MINPNSLKNLTYRFPKNNIPWNKNVRGIHLSPNTEFKNGRKDEKHPEWKGELASYSAIHHWLKRWKGKPSVCEHCGTKSAKIFNWANLSGEYKRELEDYISLCRKCHHEFDNISSKLWNTRRLQ